MIVSLLDAVTLLKEGRVVAIPTDTVYGLAADFRNDAAIDSLFGLKGRSFNNPFVLLLSKSEDIEPFLGDRPEGLDVLMEMYWPGPLTIVIPVILEKVSERVRAGLLTTGFRVPKHVVAQELLGRTGPLAVTSANRSNSPPACSERDVEKYFGEDFPVVMNQKVGTGEASTVVCYEREKWLVKRSGAISQREIDKVLSFRA